MPVVQSPTPQNVLKSYQLTSNIQNVLCEWDDAAHHCPAGDSHGRCRMNHCAIAAGDRPILIRCALQHPRNDIFGGAVRDGKININLQPGMGGEKCASSAGLHKTGNPPYAIFHREDSAAPGRFPSRGGSRCARHRKGIEAPFFSSVNCSCPVYFILM